MASVNKVQIIGNVCKSPELRYSPSGTAFCTLSIATNRSWKNKETGEKVEEAEFHRVVFNDKLAEIVGQYAKQGKPLYVEGRLKLEQWEDKTTKEKRSRMKVILEQFQFLGGKDDAPAGGGEQQQRPAASTAQPDRHSPPARASSPPRQAAQENLDEDVPF